MATPAATLAVLRASRPRCRHASDVLAFAVHAATCSAGFRLVAAGPGANDPSAASAPADPSADPLDGWDAWEDTHAFRYVPETTSSLGARLVRDETASSNIRETNEEEEIRSVTVTSMTVGDACVVSVGVVRGSGKKNETASLQVPLAQHVDASLASTDPVGALRDVDALVALANKRLFSFIGAWKKKNDEETRAEAHATSDGTAVRESFRENARRPPPLEHGRVQIEQPRPPPGARFDPYGPPDVPEFAPGRFGFDPDRTAFGFPENPDAAFGGVPDGFHPSWPGGPNQFPFPPGGSRGFPPRGWPPARGRGRGPPDLGPPPRGGGGFF